MPSKVIDTILLFGDSATELAWVEGGYVQRLAQLYARKLDVINRGLSGYTTEWALPVFEQTFPRKNESSPNVRLLLLWLGGNDTCLLPSPQHVPLDQYIFNLKRLILMVRSPDSEWYSPNTRIILVTPGPFNETVRGARLAARNPPIALDRKSEVTRSYADGVIALGKDLGIPVVDVYTPIWEATGNGDTKRMEEYLYDGLHLSKLGYDVVFNLLIKTIEKEFPELHHDALPMVFPDWKDLDWENPRASIN
ncbi:hypothetical protein FRB90_002695 [Tulasnella sp. 427]|nr:hypothetical protein FRB90_002695 [Tulasnella sp. 427]